MEINEGKNVSEVLAAVSEGSNEIGIVYATDAASVADKVDVIAEAPADALKTPVLYPVGLIEDKEASEDDTAAAEAFLEYIKSDDAMKVFEKYGSQHTKQTMLMLQREMRQKQQKKQMTQKQMLRQRQQRKLNKNE